MFMPSRLTDSTSEFRKELSTITNGFEEVVKRPYLPGYPIAMEWGDA